MPEISIDTTPLNQNDEISIREILSILSEQKVFIVVFCLSAILTALALTYIASEKYESATTIAFRPQEVIRFKAHESEAFGAPLPIPPFEMISKNLNEIVHSENLLRAVVIELKLDKEIKGPTEGPWYMKMYWASKDYLLQLSSDTWMILKHGRIIKEDPVYAATKALRKNVSFIDKSAYIFYIIVRDKYPKRAPMIVNSIASHLIEYLHEEQKSPGSANKLRLQNLLNDKMAEMQLLQAELEKLLTENTIISLSLEAEQSMTRWSSLELERVQLEGEIKKIKASLSDSKKYSDKQQTRNTGSKKTQFIRPDDFKKLSSDRLFGSIELQGLLAKHQLLQTEIASLEKKLKTLPAIKNRIEHLTSQIGIIKRDFVQVSDAYQEALILSTSVVTEAEVLHPATTPKTPVAPVKIYNVGLAALLSLFIGIALVYLLTYAEIAILFSPKKGLTKNRELSLKAEKEKETETETKIKEQAIQEKETKKDRRLRIVNIPFADRRTGNDRRA